MAIDEYDNDFDHEFTPEEVARIKRSIQDAAMGFTYEMVDSEEGFMFKCNKCGRVSDLHDRPFPHKLNCPMKSHE